MTLFIPYFNLYESNTYSVGKEMYYMGGLGSQRQSYNLAKEGGAGGGHVGAMVFPDASNRNLTFFFKQSTIKPECSAFLR